jgi:hypothetical protein
LLIINEQIYVLQKIEINRTEWACSLSSHSVLCRPRSDSQQLLMACNANTGKDGQTFGSEGRLSSILPPFITQLSIWFLRTGFWFPTWYVGLNFCWPFCKHSFQTYECNPSALEHLKTDFFFHIYCFLSFYTHMESS